MRTTVKLAAVATVALTALGATAVPAQAKGSHHTIWAAPGTGTISAAVAAARPGDTIKLHAGTYFDSVFIPISLTIDGAGWSKTVIRPPNSSDNPCNDGGMAGLCAVGAFDPATGELDTSQPVEDVAIKHLRVTGFTGTGVLGFNTDGLRVTKVRADHDGGYGIARFVSTDSVFEGNWTSYNEEAGLYMGDSPHADSVVRNNWSDHNGFGIFLRDSTEITASHNTVWGNCIGILALNSGDGAPGDLPAGDYRIVHNTAWANDRACPSSEDEGQPPLSGIGIALAGVHDTVVEKNVARANVPGGDTLVSGGIVIISTADTGGADPIDNVIRHNMLRDNEPADIVWDGTGSGNQVTHNKCQTAIPANLGWC
jgi:Right handed beta helix region